MQAEHNDPVQADWPGEPPAVSLVHSGWQLLGDEAHADLAEALLAAQALKNLQAPRENVVIATQVFGETSPGPKRRSALRGHIIDGVKTSLNRLQLGAIRRPERASLFQCRLRG